MKCFYHRSDLDGKCSGAIVKYKYPECELFGIDYGETFPIDAVGKEETVFMVDFFLEPYLNLQELARRAGQFIWIDHHKTAIEDHNKAMADGGPEIEGLRRVGTGACELTWNYLFLIEVPRAVRLLALYDVWDHRLPEVLPFQFGVRTYNAAPDNRAFWANLFRMDFDVSELVKEGGVVLRQKEISDRRKAESLAFETQLDGLNCLAMNALGNSKTFESIWDPEKYDAMVCFAWVKDKWKFVLFSDRPDVDVSIICKKRGGGGHKGAAGFICQSLPLVL